MIQTTELASCYDLHDGDVICYVLCTFQNLIKLVENYFYVIGALSNIPQFFQHLRDNLEALQFDEDEEGNDEGESVKTDMLLGQSDDPLFPYGSDDVAIHIPSPPGNY